MCLVVLAIEKHPDYPLIVLGNRDEFHARPSQDANWWPDKSGIVGGRDLQAGGTWLALHRRGRFATVTNYRDAQRERGKLRSRGHLVTDFLESDLTPVDYLRQINGADYAGFNLIAADRRSVAYLSNRGADAQELPAGIYGLSNSTLDAPSDKVKRSKAALGSLIEQDRINETALLRVLEDRSKGPIDEVSTERLSFSMAHALSAPFIVLSDYGTRCSTIVLAQSNGDIRFLERRFDAAGVTTGESRYSFAAGGE